MILARVLAGALALVLGRKLFWLFVGVVGFAVGMEVGTRAYWGAPDLTVLTISLAAGVIGAFLAFALQEVMISVVGFAAGGYLCTLLLTWWMPYAGRTIWIAFLVGGILGAWLLVGLFDWTLIVLSSLFGAASIVQAVPLAAAARPIVLLGLLVAGIIVQANLMHRRPRPPRL